MKSVLIGSHPKGFPEPFHPDTRSGKVLRNLIGNRSDSFIFFDLWADEHEQKRSLLDTGVTARLSEFIDQGYSLIALGRVVGKALVEHKVPHIYMPHPACRRTSDREKLFQYFHLHQA